MMKKLLKPANIAFYLLMALAFFILGLYYAGFIEAGKNQGLAGGAIVLGYGVLFGGIAFIASFFIAYYVPHKWIVRSNWALLLCVGIAYGITHYNFKQKNRKKDTLETPTQVPTKANTQPTALFSSEKKSNKKMLQDIQQEGIGIGFFKPNFYEFPTLYFYGGVNLEKGVAEHIAQDSLSLRQHPLGSFNLVSAPPYLWPAYNKSDMGVLYFKVLALGFDFLEVEVNSKTGQTAYLDKKQGTLLFWPEFLLTLNEVEFKKGKQQQILLKPLDFASEVTVEFSSLKPIAATDSWLNVLLQNEKSQTVNRGWIRWRKKGKLLIDYEIAH
jgi:hypothetical protein